MASKKLLSILNQGWETWNLWRSENPGVKIGLRKADLAGWDLRGYDLHDADLKNARLTHANLSEANFNGANLEAADLLGAHLYKTQLRNANLKNARLVIALLVKTNLEGAALDGCAVYGASVWNTSLRGASQEDLKVTPLNEPVITVDDLEVAQFIYTLLNNEKLRNVIDEITSKAVLILGRFGIPERKKILDALRVKLRELGFLPIVFDFEKPTDKDLTETIMTLAGMSLFVIADVTSPKSSPLELQSTVPNYQIPFVPIIQGEEPFSMLGDLQGKYDWVLDVFHYKDLKELMDMLEPAVVNRALKKHHELRKKKAGRRKILTAADFRRK